MNSAIRRILVALLLVCLLRHAAGQTPPVSPSSDSTELLKKIEALEQENKRLEQENQRLTQQVSTSPESSGVLQENESSMLDLSLEELMSVDVSTASLTATSKRKTPYTMTTITREDIRNSGARSLYELLEIYVPNFQWMFQGIFPRHMGLRGIIDGRDDKYLLLVNGRQMNEKTNFGVLSERDLPMLTDIQRIDVVRGPGSAIFGAGALAMVINLVIDDPKSFQGTEVTTRSGMIERYYSGEFKWSKMFSDNQGLLIYGGATEYDGANGSNSPINYGINAGTLKYGKRYYVNNYYDGPMRDYNQSYSDWTKMKLHAHYLYDDLNIWARYTQGGEYADQSEWGNLENGLRPRDILYGMGYRQATITAGYKQELSEVFSLNYHLSYDRTQVETEPYSVLRELLYREDEYQGRIMANWDIHEGHSMAFGGEWIHEEFGLDPDGWDETMNYRMGDRKEMPRWGTDMRSLIGEYQWNINDKLTAFLSGRLDDHAYVDTMFSPRGALVYTPDQKNTWKFMASKASRTNVAEELKNDNLRGLSNSEYETLNACELHYERQSSKQLSWGFNIFSHSHDVVSWYTSNTRPIGNFKSYGLELEGVYTAEDYKIRFAHTFTKLNKIDLADGITSTELAVTAPGYETNFANWANNQTKLSMEHKLAENLLLTNSMIVYWGYPGALDFASSTTTIAPKAYDFFDPSYFWNMGLEYRHSKNTTFRIDAYNILGWFDNEAGKRLYGFTSQIPAMYRVQPASFGFMMSHTF